MDALFDRLSSFLSCPDHIILPTLALAESGFRYKGNGDEVECYCCGLRLRQWKEDDPPAERHSRYRPQCPVSRETYQTLTANKSSITRRKTERMANNPKESQQRKQCSDSVEQTSNPTDYSNRSVPFAQNTIQTNDFPFGNIDSNFRKFTQNKDNQSVQDNQQLETTVSKKVSSLQSVISQGNNGLLQRNACANSKELSPRKQHKDLTDELEYKRPQENITTAPYEPSFDIYGPSTCIPPQTNTVPTTRNPPVCVNVDYKVAANRMETFKDWPSNAVITAEEAVEAGLYYVGQIDKVRCPWCKGGLYDWNLGDTAMGEHSRHFPQCEFVQQSQANSGQHTPVDTKANRGNGKTLIANKETMNGQVVIEHQQNIGWRSFNAVKLVLEMGYNETLIERAVIKYQLDASILTDQLLDFLFHMEDNEGSHHEDEARKSSKTPSISSQERGASGRNEEGIQKELSLLVNENQRLKNHRTCAVCLENEISMVFMPCRHLACCQTCSESVDKCPLCREPIVGTVKSVIP